MDLEHGLTAFRAEDFLFLHFEFFNLRVLQSGQGQTLNFINPNHPAFIVVHFPPQNMAERAFFEAADQTGQQFKLPSSDPDARTQGGGTQTEAPTAPPIDVRLADWSRLVFKVPAKSGPIPLTLQDLLVRCMEYDLSIASSAHGPKLLVIPPGGLHLPRPAPPTHNLILQYRAWLLDKFSLIGQRAAALAVAPPSRAAMQAAPAPAPTITAPAALETAIEMPYRLSISQNQYGAWAHSPTPVRSSETKRTELWHTRSAIRKTTGAPLEENSPLDILRRCSAIWTRDWNPASTPPTAPPPHQNNPFRSSLDPWDRHNIVLQSANKNIIDVRRLMLSSLGGWMDVQASWDPNSAIQEWRHIATIGRDHYARVVYKGYLFPFGHSASLVKVTERKFDLSLPGNPAYLRQRMYIVVREPEKLFVGKAVNPDQKRYDLQMPFQRVRITTMVTPDLDAPADPMQFYPMVGGKDFLFHMIAEGLDGKEIDFSAPLLYLHITRDNPSNLGSLPKNYETQKGTYDLRGQKVIFAESTDPNAADRVKPGSTTLETSSITFGAEILADEATLPALNTPCHFYPAVRGAQVVVPAIRHLAGNDAPVGVKYPAAYLQHGFDSGNPQNPQNTGQVFLEIVSGVSDVNFAAAGHGDRTGALITPNMKMSGVSRLLGPVAGTLDKVRTGTFDPTDFFKNALPLLFGTIPLDQILTRLGFSDLSRLPRFMTEAVTVVEELLQDITAVQSLVGKLSGPRTQAKAPSAAMPSAAIPVDLINAVVNDVTQIIKDLEQLVNSPLNPPQTLVADLQKLAGDQQNSGDLQKLVDSLPTVDDLADARKSLQQICTRLNQEVADPTFHGALVALEQLTVKFEWNPQIQPWPATDPIFSPANPDACTISVELHVQRSTGEPSADIYCGLRNFRLNLIPPTQNVLTHLITLHFDVVEFTAAGGKKPDINVKLNPRDGIQFVGVLSFVETLRQLIPLDGFSDPPALSVTADGIDASYSVGVPTVGVGVFTLQNLSLGAGFNVPFIGKPLSVRFNFCTREQPFLITVAMFGGGGFFGLVIDPHGVQRLEAALEFGASVAVNFGVASGGVSVMAGIYFSMTAKDASLDGFLRMDGHVEVLGIVTVSIVIDLELQYDSASNSVAGDATIIIEVSVLFFSASVPLHCHKQFAGGEPTQPTEEMARRPGAAVPLAAAMLSPANINRVTFEDLMKPDANIQPWHDYCRAFA